MEKRYKNLCISPLYVKSVGAHIEVNGTFINKENDELKGLVRDRKISVVEESKEKVYFEEEIKPKKEKKAKSVKQTDNHEENKEEID